jgi:cysteine desulfuration protein SufE
MTADELIADFAFLDSWEDRYRYLIDLGKQLPPLDEAQRHDANLVPGCLSRVWLHRALVEAEGGPRLQLRADSDAHITKGLVALALALFDGATPAEALALDLDDFFERLDLGGHISVNRRNGFLSMIEAIRAFARACGG